MAKKKTVVTTVSDADEVELPGINPDIGEDAELDPFAALRALGVDQQIRFNVYKVSGKPGSQTGYCQQYTPEDFSIEAVRDNYGGGKYAVRAVNEKGRIVRHTTFEVLESARPVAAEKPSMLAQLAEIKPLLELFHPPAPQNNNELLLAFMKSQGELMSTIMNRQPPSAPPPLSIADVLQVFQAMKPANTKDPVEMLMDGLKMGRELSGEGGGETGMMDVAAKGLEMVKELARNPAPQPAPRMRVNPRISHVPGDAPAIPATAPAQPAPAAEPAKENPQMGLMQQLKWLQTQVNLLVYQAGRESDAALYAEVMLDNLPAYITIADIDARIGADSAIDDLISIDKRVASYRPWFEEFRTAVMELLEEMSDDKPGDSPTPESPPGGNIEGDGDGMEDLA